MNKSLILVLVLSASVAYARPHYMEAGVGSLSDNRNKFLEVGGGNANERLAGVWGAGHAWVKDGNDFYYGRMGIGVAPETSPIRASFYVGPALISATDNNLSTNFQFCLEANVMILDSRNVGLGITAKHFSNAGIKEPNTGREFYGVRVIF